MILVTHSIVRNQKLIIIVGMFLAICMGIGAAISVKILFMPLICLGAIWLITSPRFRLLFVVFGSMFVFQSSDGLSAIKIGFLMGFALVLVLSLQSLRREENVWPLIKSLLIFALYLLILIAFSPLRGMSVTSAIRDALPYLMFAAVPIIALDLSKKLNKIFITRMIVISGSISTIAFCLTWMDMRGIFKSGFDFGLATGMFPAALFAFVIANGFQGRRRKGLWVLLGIIIIASLFATGTRSILVFLAAPFFIAIIGKKDRGKRIFKAGGVGLLIILLGWIGVQFASTNTSHVTDKILARLTTINVVFDKNYLNSDASFIERSNQTQVSYLEFSNHKVFGVGPGYGFDVVRLAGNHTNSFTLDSPFSFAAKFGIVGILLLLNTFIGLTSYVRKSSFTVAMYGLIGFVGVTSVWQVLSPPFEDKGFMLGILLLLTASLRAEIEPDQERIKKREKYLTPKNIARA